MEWYNINTQQNNEKSNEGSVDMATVIRQIIEFEEQADKEFREYQIARIKYLNNFHKLPQAEQNAERERIFVKLKSIGILDENGELSERYRYTEE